MSNDTDYTITIKGKDTDLRKGAADFIELALHPWQPLRDDKKTLTRLEVFRNESRSSGLFDPSTLCEEAATLFPGVDVGFSSKNEYGATDSGSWGERGEPSKDPLATAASHLLNRIKTDIAKAQNQVDWLGPLEEWADTNGLPERIRHEIGLALTEAQAAKSKETAVRDAEAALEANRELEATKSLERCLRWNFHPVLAAESVRLGSVGKVAICDVKNQKDQKGEWREVWRPLLDGATFGDCEEAFGIALTVAVESKEAAAALRKQLDEQFWFGESARLSIRTRRGIRASRTHLKKDGTRFLLCLKKFQTSDFKEASGKLLWDFCSQSNSTTEAAKVSAFARVCGETESLWQLNDLNALTDDKCNLSERINGHCVASSSCVFTATETLTGKS